MTINYAKIFAENQSRVIKMNSKIDTAKVKSKIDKLEKTDLWTIKWVWDGTVKILLENWISSLDELREAWIDNIDKINLNPFSFRAIKEFLQNK